MPGRLQHLLAEQGRIGTLQFTYDAGGNPQGYSASPPSSYIGKLIQAYEILGGDPLFDLQVRQMSQPIFIVAGTETTPAQQLSSGDILGQPGLQDAPTATAVQQMKAWAPDVLQWKRENIERKVRRALDYSDQLTAEINTLSMIMNSSTTSGSLAYLTSQVTTLLADPTYRAIYNDVLQDLHGKYSHAPFAAYEPGPNRQIDPNFVRGEGGPVLPGQQAASTNQTSTTPQSTQNAATPLTGPSTGILP